MPDFELSLLCDEEMCDFDCSSSPISKKMKTGKEETEMGLTVGSYETIPRGKTSHSSLETSSEYPSQSKLHISIYC